MTRRRFDEGSDHLISRNNTPLDLGVFRHVAENHRQIRALIGSRGIDLAQRAVLDALTERARSTIERRATAGEQSAVPADDRAAFFAGSLMAIITWWLDNDMPYPPESINEMYQELTKTT
ncbi:MAG: TetR family transcriptional regulator C-terminal domain-containing protein [Acidobacteria bacterium]|nr:TetR family transcriptional regulator C-terminal domain-containing protein [Acidobacteriota bacterium]